MFADYGLIRRHIKKEGGGGGGGGFQRVREICLLVGGEKLLFT